MLGFDGSNFERLAFPQVAHKLTHDLDFKPQSYGDIYREYREYIGAVLG